MMGWLRKAMLNFDPRIANVEIQLSNTALAMPHDRNWIYSHSLAWAPEIVK